MLHFTSTEPCKGLVQLAAQISLPGTKLHYAILTTENRSNCLTAAVIRESTEVIAARQERGFNAPEIIPVALAPVIIEEQAEQVETVAYEIFNHGGHHGCARLIHSNL